MFSVAMRSLSWAMLMLGSVVGQSTTRVSVSSAGGEGNDLSSFPAISSNGRFVAFMSQASNLVSADTNGLNDVFLHDRLTGITSRISTSTLGVQANADCWFASVADDGSVVFESGATSLVTGDSNSTWDIFVHNANASELVSVSSTGQQANAASSSASISPDGRYVAFSSSASNLVPADINAQHDVFLRDLVLDTTELVSVSSFNLQGNNGSSTALSPALSADARYVAFFSAATTLVISDTNGKPDIFVRDRLAGQTTRVSVSTAGVEGNDESSQPSISPDGRYVVFKSVATNLVPDDTNGVADIFMHDMGTHVTSRVSVSTFGAQANAQCDNATVSADGRYVSFVSGAGTLVVHDGSGAKLYIRDTQLGLTIVGDQSADGATGNESIGSHAQLTPDGAKVTFYSAASNLVIGDTNGMLDVFVRDLQGAWDTPWTSYGGGSAGTHGVPLLDGFGSLAALSTVTLKLSGALESAPAVMIIGLNNVGLPLKGGVLIPSPDVVFAMSTGPNGGIVFAALWPPGIPAGTSIFFQFWIGDAVGQGSMASSNGIAGTQP